LQSVLQTDFIVCSCKIRFVDNLFEYLSIILPNIAGCRLILANIFLFSSKT